MTMSVSNQQIIEALYAISKDRFNQPDMLMEIEALPMIAKAISKAVGEDTIAYIENCQTVTANAIRLLIIDNINTNIKKYLSACTDDLELRYLNISGWKRLLIIDHTHKLTFTVHSAVSLKNNHRVTCSLLLSKEVLNHLYNLRCQDLNQTTIPKMILLIQLMPHSQLMI